MAQSRDRLTRYAIENLWEPFIAEPNARFVQDLLCDLMDEGPHRLRRLDAVTAVRILEHAKGLAPDSLQPALDLGRRLLRPLRRRLEDQLAGPPPASDIENPVTVAEPVALSHRPSLDIVVCVHNALDDVQACLGALDRERQWFDRLILIDDGSAPRTKRWLESYVNGRRDTILHRTESATGYTRAANRGLRATSSELVLLLNSDAILTEGALPRLMAAFSDSRVAGAGPISNAASWQSVPVLKKSDGDWAVNSLPPGFSPQRVAEIVCRAGAERLVQVPLLNGFCLMLRREAALAIGFLDEGRFPNGYGEENDLCIRLVDAGYRLVVASSAYVFHAKSKSYSHRTRRSLEAPGGTALKRKHGRARVHRDVETLRDNRVLAELRTAVHLASPLELDDNGVAQNLRVLFILPVAGGGGGAHSVVQEAAGLRRLGMDARVAVRSRDLPRYLQTYPELPSEVFLAYVSDADLVISTKDFDLVVATIFSSVELLRSVARAAPRVARAYYVQDYEPYFFREGDESRKLAEASYDVDAHLFAKTDWIRETVKRFHGRAVAKVSPSLDHEVFFPADAHPGRFTIAAMIRPSTPRRNAALTMRVLSEVCEQFPQARVGIFGASRLELRKHRIPRDFPHRFHGKLGRFAVANVLRQSALFVDFSTYQAFGRTALEAMACGTVPIVPRSGGTGEFLRHSVNGWQVDTEDEQACFSAIEHALRDPVLSEKRLKALETAALFSIEKAALSEARLFSTWVRDARGYVHPSLVGSETVPPS